LNAFWKVSCIAKEETASDDLSGDTSLTFQTVISMALTQFPSETKMAGLAAFTKALLEIVSRYVSGRSSLPAPPIVARP